MQSPVNSTLPSVTEWSTIKEQVAVYLRSGFLPKSVATPEQALTIAMKGRELGIPPLHAFAHINIVQGKPVISSELMLALIYKNCPGATIAFETKEEGCIIMASRGDGKPQSKFWFSMDDAEQAGLLSKDNWRKHPASMLRARAISAMARAMFPDCIMGCSYTPEELGAQVNEEGEVIDHAPKDAPPDNHPAATEGNFKDDARDDVPPAPPKEPEKPKASQALIAKIFQEADKKKISLESLKKGMKISYGTTSASDLTHAQAEELFLRLVKKQSAEAPAITT